MSRHRYFSELNWKAPFKRFATVCLLAIVPESIQKRQPPEPDSPDERHLYVGNWDPERKVVMRYEVRPDGSLAAGRVFFDMTGAPGDDAIRRLDVVPDRRLRQGSLRA